MWNRFPPRVRRLIVTATEVAGQAGCEDVASEHLVLAIARDTESAACWVFDHAGVEQARLIDTLERIVPRGGRQRQRAARLSAATMHLLDVAKGEADRLNHRHLG